MVYLEFFCSEKISILPIYLFNYSLVPVWSYKYLFYTLDYNPVILVLLLKLSIFVYWESFQLVLMPFDIPHQWVLLFCERFLTLWHYVINTPDTSGIFSVPRISHVSKQPLLENGNRNQIWMLGMLITTEPFQLPEQRNIYFIYLGALSWRCFRLLTDLKGQINNKTIIDFNAPFSTMGRIARQKINRETEDSTKRP